uniref:hypothetical protein n=1 Tax=Rhodococcus sp. R1101 TaxID=1170698 RepID=UPI00056130D1
ETLLGPGIVTAGALTDTGAGTDRSRNLGNNVFPDLTVVHSMSTRRATDLLRPPGPHVGWCA